MKQLHWPKRPASDALIIAALLRDLGHLLNPQGDASTVRGIDDQHQSFALPFLRGVFPDAVLEPIRPHVEAKRCLCAIDQHYHECLSADSVHSLALQGGCCPPMRPTPFCTTLTPPMRCACAAGTIAPR